MRSEDRKVVKKALLPFPHLWPAFEALLTGDTVVRTFKKGETLWTRGSAPNRAHIVLSGRLAVLENASDSTETLIEIYQPGDLLAGSAVMAPRQRWQFSGKAIEDAKIWIIPAEALRRQLVRDPRIGLSLATNLARIWYRLAFHILDFKKLSSNQRLAKYLVGLADKRSGGTEVTLADDQLLIAGMLGVTRESLSRSFAQLRAHGVAKRGRKVTIADVARLRRLAEGRLKG